MTRASRSCACCGARAGAARGLCAVCARRQVRGTRHLLPSELRYLTKLDRGHRREYLDALAVRVYCFCGGQVMSPVLRSTLGAMIPR